MSDANKEWVRQQVQRIRAETNYTSMKELAEKQRKPSYQSMIHNSPEYTLDEYESMRNSTRPSKDVVDIVTTITRNKKNSNELEDIAAMYSVKKHKK